MTTSADGDPGPAPTMNALGSLPSPLDSVGDMRAAAKWMLAAAGAVGAALISGGPLVAIGQVHGGLNIFLAVLGLVFAVIGVGIAIWFTSEVLVPRLTTPLMFRSSQELQDLREIINAEPGEFVGAVTLGQDDAEADTAAKDDATPAQDDAATKSLGAAKTLPVRLRRLRQIAAGLVKQMVSKNPDAPSNPNDPVNQLFARQEALRQNVASLVRLASTEKDPQRREQYQAQVRRVTESGERIATQVRYVLALGHAWGIKAALHRARIATLAGAAMVILGALLFFIATASNGATHSQATTPYPAPAASPTAAETATP